VCPTDQIPPSEGIKGAELVVFEHLSQASLHEDPEGFNRATLEFLIRQKLWRGARQSQITGSRPAGDRPA
jgi:hypothetical protein